MLSLTFETKKETLNIKVSEPQGNWLYAMIKKISNTDKAFTLQDIQKDYEDAGLEDFELFWDNKPMNTVHKAGLLQL